MKHIGNFAAVLVTVLYSSWVGMLLFNWFVPLVFNVAPISFVVALGLRYAAAYWLHPISAADITTNTKTMTIVGYSFVFNTLLLIGGAFIHYVII